MSNKNISESEFLEILSLLAQGYGKNNTITKSVHRLARLTRDKWTLVNLKAVGGGPSVNLNIKTRDRIINLSLDLATKLNVLVFKKYANEKNYKCRNRGQEELGTSDTENQD
jgi:hypothetical protein